MDISSIIRDIGKKLDIDCAYHIPYILIFKDLYEPSIENQNNYIKYISNLFGIQIKDIIIIKNQDYIFDIKFDARLCDFSYIYKIIIFS